MGYSIYSKGKMPSVCIDTASYCMSVCTDLDCHCIIGAAGAITAMIIKRLGYAEKYWSLLFTINGGLTGMVRNKK